MSRKIYFAPKADINQILNHVEAKVVQGGWANARCPLHKGKRLSLGIKCDYGNSTVGFNCKGGCSNKDIVQYFKNLGLLWFEKRGAYDYL